MVMIIEAALGAVFGELLKSILETIDKAVNFKPTLENLQSTLIQIAPVIQDIVELNNKLGCPNEDLEPLIRKMKEGTMLIYECSNLRTRDFIAKGNKQKELEALSRWLGIFFKINMPAQIARDQKQNLVETRKILSILNKKLHIDQIGASSNSTPVFGKVNASENVSGTNSAKHQGEQIKIGDTESSFLEVEVDEGGDMQKPQQSSTETPRGSRIIGDEYCKPFPMFLLIFRSVKELRFDKLIVKNIKNGIIFNLERPSFSRYTLFDNHGNPVITLHSRTMTVHNRWQVFRGKSDQRNDLIFSIKKPNIIQLKNRLDVFLAKNTEEKDYNFMGEGNLTGSSYCVYAGQSRDTIAEVVTYNIAPTKLGSIKQCVVVRVKPNVDFAFIVALFIVVLSG